jgi:tetratricopeptide (TPR) repeat protein
MAKRETLNALKNRAKKLLDKQRFQEARDAYVSICQTDTQDYDAFNQLAALSIRLGLLSDAEVAYKHACSLRPDDATPFLNLGLLYKNHGRIVDAEPWLRRSMQLAPAGALEYKRLGISFQQMEYLDLAISVYRELLQHTPNDGDTYNNLGVALHNRGHLEEALASFAKALTVAPPKAHLYCNMANVYVDKGDSGQAHHCYQQALLLDPNSTYALGSLGALYIDQMRLDEALACLDKANAIDPDFAGAHWNRAQILLLQGKFKQGWQEYEARLHSPEVIKRFGFREFSKPMWDGGDIGDKTLLVYAEQGFGDAIQFCRYLPLLQARIQHLVFECRPELLRLMQGLPGNIKCIARRDDSREPAIPFDCRLPLMSLPRIFGTALDTIPANIPYLVSDAALTQQWRSRIQNNGLKVGLVWAGSPSHQSNRYRSLSLAQLLPLANIPGVTFYSLQKGTASAEATHPPAGMTLIDLSGEINDFADTAAIISNLDLVISVDTAVAHLAGALGKPAWVMLYYPPEWRWLLDRNDSPWYPDMRLFRQGAAREWEPVLAQVASALRALVNH